jgi:hypothetical protein
MCVTFSVGIFLPSFDHRDVFYRDMNKSTQLERIQSKWRSLPSQCLSGRIMMHLVWVIHNAVVASRRVLAV